MLANGVSLGTKTSEDHFFYFDVPNVSEETRLVACAGDKESRDVRDKSYIKRVENFHEEYRLKEKSAILNWFDITEKEGFFSLNDKIGDILASEDGKRVFAETLKKFIPQKGSKVAGGFEMNETMIDMLGGFTVIRLSGMMSTMGIELTKEELLDLNSKLNKVKKPK